MRQRRARVTARVRATEDRGSIAVVLLVLVVMTVLAGAVVERSIAATRAGRAEVDRSVALAAADLAVADAGARLDLGQTGAFTQTGTAAGGATWWYSAAPVAGGYRVDAAGSAGAALRQRVAVLSRTGGGGWRPSSSREVPPSPYALAVLSTPGLQAYWRLDETSGTSFTDASGNGRTGVMSGTLALNQAGALGGSGDGNAAVSFSGSPNRIEVGDQLDFPGRAPFTVAAWIRPTGSGTEYQYPLAKDGTTGSTRNGWILGWRRSTQQAYVVRIRNNVIQSTVDLGTEATAPPGEWSHVVGTYDGDTLRIYVNGTLRNSVASTQSMVDTTHLLMIGSSESSHFVVGRVDEPGIWNRALSASEIARLYEAGTTGRVSPPGT